MAALAAMVVGANAQTPVERGSYLVNTIGTCQNCHTPAGPGGPVLDRAFSGGPQVWDTPMFTARGANITQDRETAIGAWSILELKKALIEGVRPNGVPIAPIMPTAYYGVLTERDRDAIAAYLKTVKAVRNEVPSPTYKTAIVREIPPGGDKQMTDAELTDPVNKGFYLATFGHCMECHTPRGATGQSDFSRLGAGGEEFQGPWGVSVSRNITSHQTKGIGAWTDAQIKAAITDGVRPDGTKLKPPMGFGSYKRMTDADLTAVVAWLRTVPAKE